MKKVIITGATGMTGGLVLKECINSKAIANVVVLTRRSTKNKSAKVKEIICQDQLRLAEFEEDFRNVDIAYYCLGAYTGAVPDELFKSITVDFPIEFARMLKVQSPGAILCLLSGAGADRSEKSRTAFARYKGMTENALVKLELGGLYVFRPGYIYPVHKRKSPNFMYSVSRFLYPILKLFGNKYSIKSTELARAMFTVLLRQPAKITLENEDILATLKE